MANAATHRGVRVAHAVLGGMAAVGWLVLPWATGSAGSQPGPAPRPRPAARPTVTAPAHVAQPGEDETSTGDLVLPLLALGTAGALAAFSFVRRTRRARTRTTPGGGAGPAAATPAELALRGRRSLVETDDCVRTGAEELGFVVGRLGEEAARPFTEALESARSGLAMGFRLRQWLDDDSGRLPADEERGALEEIIALCAAAGRLLDAKAAAFDQLRGLERDLTGPLQFAEARFRQLTGRVPGADATLDGLRERYGPAACLPVSGHTEQARDRLVFATAQLNGARQTADVADHGTAAARLRAAEGAIHQADLFVTGVDRLATELASAVERLPAVLAAAEASLGEAGAPQDRETAASLAKVRREVAAGAYDPLDALHRIVRVAAPGSAPTGPYAAELLDAALLTARSAVNAAIGFVTTHRGAVGSEARTRLAEAERHLALAQENHTLVKARHAGLLAREARRLAWQDVRAHGNPYGGPFSAGLAGALLGGILLGDPPGDRGARGPACFGGPATRGRRSGNGVPF